MNAAAAISADCWLAAIENGKLTVNGRPAQSRDLPDYARIRRRDRERRVETAFRLMNRRLRSTTHFLWPQIVDGLSGGTGVLGNRGFHIVQHGPMSVNGLARLLSRKLSTSEDPDALTDTIRHREWRVMKHIVHLVHAVSQARDLPADEVGLRRLLDDAERCRLFALPALPTPIPPSESLQFRPQS